MISSLYDVSPEFIGELESWFEQQGFAKVPVKQSKINFDLWQNFSPTVTQLGAATITNQASRYVQVGKTVTCELQFSIGAVGGTGGNDIVVGNIPVAAASSLFGHVVWANWAGGVYTFFVGGIDSVSTTTFKIRISGAVTGALGTAPNIAANQFDYVRGLLVYEAA